MSAELAAVLRSGEGVAVPLVGVTAQGRLAGLVFELAVEQRYENTGGTNIEAEYTFPVPHRAVLLGLELQIGERALQAVAVKRARAREDYEAAIDAGDSAALLEQAGDGLFTLSLGNLMAGESARIRYRYAQVLDRAGDEVRLAVPTVVAPRYGAAAEHGLAPHQAPEADLLAGYPFALELDVLGPMAEAALHSPSHAIEVAAIEGGRRVRLAPGAALDRDFVLTVTGPQTRAACLVAGDGEGAVALLSLDPQLPEPAAAPLALKILVDCSGSMGGDSIGCARRALVAILDRLDARDRVSITRFGSTVEHLAAAGEPQAHGLWRVFDAGRHEPAPAGVLAAATPAVIERLRHAVRGMDADLGGTELPGALQAVLAIPAGDARVKDILLVTDAEVWAVGRVLDGVARAGHRLFVVVVGSAPAESLARQLAEKTGGACEFVGPNEDAEAAIVRTFRRMREAPKRVARVEWGASPAWEGPLPPAVFSGDTLHLFAGFAGAAPATARVVVVDADGRETVLEARLPAPAADATLPRIAAARRLAVLPEAEAAALAERHQLASPYTSFVVVQVRSGAEQAQGLPAGVKVPQMLAAGWGATGQVMCASEQTTYSLETIDMPSPPRQSRASERYIGRHDRAPPPRRQAWGPPAARVAPGEFLQLLVAHQQAGLALPADLRALHALGVPAAVVDALHEMLDASHAFPDGEARLVRLWIALVAKSAASDGLAAGARAALIGTALADREDRAWRRRLAVMLDGITGEEWP